MSRLGSCCYWQIQWQAHPLGLSCITHSTNIPYRNAQNISIATYSYRFTGISYSLSGKTITAWMKGTQSQYLINMSKKPWKPLAEYRSICLKTSMISKIRSAIFYNSKSILIEKTTILIWKNPDRSPCLAFAAFWTHAESHILLRGLCMAWGGQRTGRCIISLSNKQVFVGFGCFFHQLRAWLLSNACSLPSAPYSTVGPILTSPFLCQKPPMQVQKGPYCTTGVFGCKPA